MAFSILPIIHYKYVIIFTHLKKKKYYIKTKEQCKNKIAKNNNFDSFAKAIQYTFNRELLQSEEMFINKIINEAMEDYAQQFAVITRNNCKWLLAKSVPNIIYFKCKDSTGWTNTLAKEDAMVFDTKEDAIAFNEWELYNEFCPILYRY